MTSPCPSCSFQLPAETTACPNCQAALAHCVQCGVFLLAGDRFCASCGSRQSLPPKAHTPPRLSSQPAAPATGWGNVLDRLRAATAGEYEIDREIGRGGMAAVYLAHEPTLSRQVAIKVMSPELMLGSGMVERFRQEAQTIARLNHPNVVTVHAIRERQGLHFIVMKYIQGRSLEAILRQNHPLPFPIVRGMLGQIGAALDYAHRHGVIHRDVKPGNVLVDADGDCVVTDFGIAKVAEGATLTNPGDPMGTPAYMSPEQCDGKTITPASDQYSFGVMAYEMVTGKRPFEGSVLTVMRAHVDRPPPAIEAARTDCPKDVRSAILRMMEKTPQRRFSTVSEAITALGGKPLAVNDPTRAAIGRFATVDVAPPVPASSEPTVPTPAKPAAAPPRPRTKGGLSVKARRRLLIGAAGALVFVVLLWIGFREPPPPPPPPPPPTTIAVEPGGDIAAALARVAIGGSVTLDSGRYLIAAPLVIDRQVTLRGRGLDQTRIIGLPDTATIEIKPSGTASEIGDLEIVFEAPGRGPGILVAADSAVITGVRLVGAGVSESDCGPVGPGVDVKGQSRAVMTRNEIRGFCHGIRVADSAAPAIVANRLSENYYGALYQGNSAGLIRENDIEANSEGITVQGGTPVIDGNRINGSKIYGINVRPQGHPTRLPNNKFSNNIQDVEQP